MPVRTFMRGTSDTMDVTFERIQLGDRTLLRPLRVEATVGSPYAAPLGAAIYPLSLYADVAPGTDPAAAPQDMLAGYHRGHLIAGALGGVNTHYNLTPMTSVLNNGAWSAFENAVRARKNAMHASPNRIYMRVTLGYNANLNDGDPSTSNAIVGWAFELPRITGLGVAAARTAALAAAIMAGVGAAPNFALQTGPHDCDTQGGGPLVFTLAQTAALNAIAVAYAARVGAAAMPIVGGGNLGGTPTGGRGDPPAGTAMGPYACLDVLEDAVAGPALIAGMNAQFGAAVFPPGGLAYAAQVKRNNQNFAVNWTQPQRTMIKLANQFMNAGRYGSDNVWYDRERRLRMSEAQIDHIIPQSHANSSNFYWNAQLTSHEYNGSIKGDQSEAAAFIAWRDTNMYGAPDRKRRRTLNYVSAPW